MKTNSAFFIGNSHVVCEDYALSAPYEMGGYAIVCDGCSASPNVDLGARIMALSAEEDIISNHGVSLTASVFGDDVISRAAECIDMFPRLSEQTLDTTLLVAWKSENFLYAYLFGDGVLIHKTKNKLSYVHVNLTSGAPDYLSYSLNKNRMDQYNKLPNNKKIIEFGMQSEFVFTKSVKESTPFVPFPFFAKAEPGDILAVISDGICSFKDKNGESIPWTNLIEEFIGFKSVEGDFVLRRLSAFKRKCLKEGITHSDDISMAAIVV